jgi:hypothetical protein
MKYVQKNHLIFVINKQSHPVKIFSFIGLEAQIKDTIIKLHCNI